VSDKRLLFLEKLVADGKADAFARYALALEYAGRERIDDAVTAFEGLRAHDATYVPMYLMAGQVLAKAGRNDAARAWLEEGVVAAKKKGDSHALGEIQGVLATLG